MLISIPLRYIPKGLNKKDRKIVKSELLKSRKMYKRGKYYDRKKVKTYKSKKSLHVNKVKRMYNKKEILKETGCSKKGLNEIKRRGMGAYYSSGSRPNQTAESWGEARVASAITGGKAATVDIDLIKKHCKKSGKAYIEAMKAVKKYGTGRNQTRKIKIKI